MFKITLLAMLASAAESRAETPDAGVRPAETEADRHAPTLRASRWQCGTVHLFPGQEKETRSSRLRS